MTSKRITTHVVKHIWEAYAKKYLIEHPECYGVQHNKIRNFYIYKNGTKKSKVTVNYPSRKQMFFSHSHQGLVISYEIFRKVIEEFLGKAKTAIINGDAVHFTHIGYICAKRVERDFRKKNQRIIDWGKTRKQEKVWNDEAGKEVFPRYIYYSDDDWCRIAWIKPGIKGETAYEFDPAAPNSKGTKGFRKEFSQAVKADPLLKYKYLYAPIKDFAQQETELEEQPETTEECYMP